MTKRTMVEDTARLGRPRDDAREQAILDAALEVVTEVGYDRLTMDTVAARAHASKATIYRRWPGKAELIADAVRRRVAPPSAADDTGSLRGDLLALAAMMCVNISGADGGLICGLAAATRTDPALAQVLGSQVIDARQQVVTTIVGRAVARGEIPSGTDPKLLLEVAPGVAMLRQMTGEALDDEFMVHLVDHILLPLLTRR